MLKVIVLLPVIFLSALSIRKREITKEPVTVNKDDLRDTLFLHEVQLTNITILYLTLSSCSGPCGKLCGWNL